MKAPLRPPAAGAAAQPRAPHTANSPAPTAPAAAAARRPPAPPAPRDRPDAANVANFCKNCLCRFSAAGAREGRCEHVWSFVHFPLLHCSFAERRRVRL